ncbi:uncharacterized protein LOC111691455 [Anoplophora glabripennis]|uniref:uncharacterized protein LOC111691455 n=1 Tax=Anoplophora glabripennis TaxID=217634 RepID=UPI000C76F279|nr:uncharacterized protein LOC111691455 [Anoplophora glabripennis]
MIRKVLVFALLVVCSTTGAKAQLCIPDTVYNINLDNTTLTWDPSTNCNTTHYIVNIHNNGMLEYIYQVDNASLDVSFLSFCRTLTFTVTAIAEHILGAESQYEATIALPTGTDITVFNFTGDQIDRDVLFQWQVDDDYRYCAESFKVRIWKEQEAAPQEFETSQNGYYLTDVSQCMYYDVEISVVHLTMEHPVAKFNYTVPPIPNNPKLVAVTQGVHTISTTWSLESYAINKCTVTALFLNGTQLVATIPISDVPERPDIVVSIPGLRADSMYFFNVSVKNEAGISDAFQMAVQTLPIDPSLKLDSEEDHFDSS